MFFRNQKFPITSFRDVKKPPIGLERRYLGKMSKQGTNFMKAILKMDPKNRITCEKALQHPYFAGLNQEFQPEARKSKSRQRHAANVLKI